MELLLAQEVGAQGLCAIVSLFTTATPDRAVVRCLRAISETTTHTLPPSMNLPLPRELPRRARGPRPVPGRSVWAAPAPLEDHSRPGLCAAAAGGDRPRSESDRFMVLMHAQSERGLPMNRDSETRMTNDEIPRNDEIRRTKPATAQLRAIGHSGFGFLSSLVIGHSSFNGLHSTTDDERI